jgi:hypothetical protein
MNNKAQDTSQIDKSSFLLKAVDPTEVHAAYLNGKYVNFSLPTSKVKIHRVEKKIIDASHYEILDKSGGITEVVACPMPSGVPLCLWCRLPTKNPVGIPIKYLEKNKYAIARVCCSFECAYAYIGDHYHRPWEHQNLHYHDAETLLLTMYSENYPGKTLTPSPPWELAAWNQGPLSEKEYFAKGRNYILVPTILIPASYEHICFNLPVT